jgi:hypothetical protein
MDQDMVIGAKERFQAFDCLISKVLHAVGQIEQFQVKITNLSGILPTGSSTAAFMSAASLLGTASGGGMAGAAALLSTTYLRGVQVINYLSKSF